jgi:hypothetical protein
MANEFDWKRFWCPRGETFNLADSGFLSDPETKWGKHLNPELVTFDQLAEVPCLALLGEPGIGKSWALQRDSTTAEKDMAREGGAVIRINLRSFGSEDRLIKDLFESADWRKWRLGNHRLHLFLDSLDECLLRVDNIASLLADELPKQPVQRLHLRIACRTAPWPTILERSLINLYGTDGFKAYELVPLRRIDVEHAAAQSGIENVAAFLARIDDLDVASLAIKPVTLEFLINIYLNEGDFPSNQIDLYERGCKALCEESNESRRGSGRTGTVSTDERLAIASRIAGVTQFANRYAVWTGNETDVASGEDVLIGELTGGTENGPDEVTVSMDAIREVLDTGLFSSRGVERIGWAHQTYAEFLAARYCKIRGMPVQQIQALLFHPSDQGRRLVPQLYELAAWISVTNQEILEIVAKSDPEALLGAAAANLSDEQRSVVVESIFNRCEAGQRLDLQWHLHQLYRKLRHPGLPTQLRPYLRDRSKLSPARHVAIDFARVCEVAELGADLADIALETSEDRLLRISAAAAAANIGSAEIRRRLLLLATGQAGDDPDDEMKGCGLIAAWPDYISASEAFNLITAPKRRNLSGVYTRFLQDKFIEKMSVLDLPAGLEWFSRQPARHLMHGAIDRLMDGIVRLAWDNLNRPGVTEGLAAAVLSRIRLHDNLLSSFEAGDMKEQMGANAERRRRLLEAVLPQITGLETGVLVTLDVPLLDSGDFEWMLERILSGNFKASAPVEAKLLGFLANINKPEQMRALWYACQASPIIASECEAFFAPMALDSQYARLLRESLQLRKSKAQPPLPDPSPSERIENDLQRIEKDQLDSWIRLTLDLSLEPTSTTYSSDLEMNLTETPGWKAADVRVRDRIIAAAFRYAEEGDPENEKWFNTSSISGAAIGGFRALALLLIAAEDGLRVLSSDVWRKWVPVLLRYPHGGGDELNLQPRLLRMACSRIPEQVVDWVRRMIEGENERSGYFFAANEIETCWDDRMAGALLDKAGDPLLKEQVVGSLLGLLIRHDVAGSVDLAQSFIRLPQPESASELGRMLAAIEALVVNASDAGWPKVWPAINESDDLGCSVIESITYVDPGHASFIRKLDESQLAELYLWMVRHYPYAEHREVFGMMSSVDTAVILRDSILEHLKKRGTFSACEAFRHIMKDLPEYTWLRHHLDEAELLARAATWQPVAAREFLTLALDGAKRLVETSGQLAEVIMESLARLDAKFHDELPAAKDLWSAKGNDFWPKGEEDMSDYVARHLREDLRDRGVIINREVQISQGIGSGSGQSTDIHVDTAVPGATPGSYDRVCVIVEVKGNWHPALLDAMKDQLRDRYLNETRCSDGIYLVGWFSCLRWSDGDYRKKKCPDMTVDDARSFFQKQAIELSNEGISLKSYVLDVSLK